MQLQEVSQWEGEVQYFMEILLQISIIPRVLLFGAEITLLEILKVRAGYFTMGLNNYGVVGDVKRLNETTYGLGIELPFRKISNVPLNIRFDHTSLPFPTYNVEFPGGKNCPVYSLSMSYDF